MKKLCFLFALLLGQLTYGQDPNRFFEEVEKLVARSDTKQLNAPIIFAGSSSIRFWETLEQDFPSAKLLNHGFGGSETTDLIWFSQALIMRYEPSKIFIYEGDNDLANGKSVDIIIADMKTLLRFIRRQLPDTPVYLISPKPSISRWHLREQYEILNKELADLCPSRENVSFINVWDSMLTTKGELNEDLFIADSLHMNEKGYEIWAKVIAPFVD